MYLKKLEISGFKSFANKTTLEFSFSQNEYSCCDGDCRPNGSGKSNIADAIRWAMGEQSMKNLRGKKIRRYHFCRFGKKAQLGERPSDHFFR